MVDDFMVASGFLIKTRQEKFEQVKKELRMINGLEIQNIIDDYKIVVVIKHENVEDQNVISGKIATMNGVLSIDLSYRHFEDEAVNT